jgi:GAF domain-containing protein
LSGDVRFGRLLDAVLAIAGDLDLETVLGRVVEAACALVDAKYGALGVIGDDGDGLSAFIHRGIDDATAAAIGPLPEGRGCSAC